VAQRLMRFAAALVVLAVFVFGTHLGYIFRDMTRSSWVALRTGPGLTFEQRRGLLLDQSYAILVDINRRTPPDAVILFPPKARFQGDDVSFTPVASTASSAYNYIYPRIPVLYGVGAPNRDRITYVVNYDHWAYETFWPDVPRTPENRFGIVPWPGGIEVP